MFVFLNRDTGYAWDKRDVYMMKNGRVIVDAIANGYCLLHALSDCAYFDESIDIPVEDLMDKIRKHLSPDFSKVYAQYHTGNEEDVRRDIDQYFRNGHLWTTPVVDLLWVIVANAMTWQIRVFFNDAGKLKFFVINKEIKPEFNVLLVNGHYMSCPRLRLELPPDDNDDKNEESSAKDSEDPVKLHPEAAIFGEDENGNDADATSGQLNNLPLSAEKLPAEYQEVYAQQYIFGGNQSGKAFPTHLFTEDDIENVERIPRDIDGFCAYRVKCTNKTLRSLTSDGRYFKMYSSSRKGLIGSRKVGTCYGYFTCTDDTCPFLTCSGGVPNHTNWQRQNMQRLCFLCGSPATSQECNARKCIEYHSINNEALVFHIGTHRCTVAHDPSRNDDYIKQKILQCPHLPPRSCEGKW